MRLDQDRSPDDVLADLTAEAERTWGKDRAEALRPALQATATALARLARAPLESLEAEPAFIGPSPGGGG